MELERDYRETLRRTLVERCQKNPRYSLRAFARDLGFLPSRLSDVLNGKKGMSRSAAQTTARALGLSVAEARVFCDQAESLHGRSQVARSQARKRLEEYYASSSVSNSQRLTLDAFRAVSDWYHFAILQLLKLPHARNDVAWIARALGLQGVQVSEALQRLERLELVRAEGGRLVPERDYLSSPDGVPSEAVRKFHEQILQKASAALVTQGVQERDFLTSLLPAASADLPRMGERIRRFNRELCEEFSSSPAPDHVYALSIQLFRLTSQSKEMKS